MLLGEASVQVTMVWTVDEALCETCTTLFTTHNYYNYTH